MTLTLSATAANAQLDALAELLDGGFLRVFTGARPATPDVPLAQDHKLLAEMRFGKQAFFGATDGLIRARAIDSDQSAKFSGEATWYRAYAADGQTAVVDGTVGTRDADLLVNNAAIQQTAIFSVQDFRLKVRT